MDRSNKKALFRDLMEAKEPFRIEKEDGFLRFIWNDDGNSYEFMEFSEDGEPSCGGHGFSNPHYDGPQPEVIHEEYFDEVPPLTKAEWKTIRWLVHHSGRFDQCGLSKKEIRRLQNILKLDEVQEEWAEKLKKG